MADEEREIEIEEIVKRVDGREHRAIKGVSKVLMLLSQTFAQKTKHNLTYVIQGIKDVKS